MPLPADHPAHLATFTADQLVAVVPPIAADLVWVDRSLPNASDTMDYRLVPGAYPVEFVDINGRTCPPETTGGDLRSYYVRVLVDVEHLGGGGTARLFTASMHVDYPAEGRTTKWFSTYAYSAAPGYVLASTPNPTPEDRWHSEPLLTLRHVDDER